MIFQPAKVLLAGFFQEIEFMRSDFFARPATVNDRAELARLINTAPRIHRHLDWCAPLDWLGYQPFWVIDSDEGLQCALVFPEDPPGTAWIHLFACAAGTNSRECWDELFTQGCRNFSNDERPVIAALGLNEWIIDILIHAGFHLSHHIVNLIREVNTIAPSLQFNSQVFIRPMEPQDLECVAAIDQQAFEPIWQNSSAQIMISYEQALYGTVAELDGNIVGYQISTSSFFSAHLARLAVLPFYQHQSIGAALLNDLIHHFQHERSWQITVNTQDNNHYSLALYTRAGFELTGEKYPVYINANSG